MMDHPGTRSTAQLLTKTTDCAACGCRIATDADADCATCGDDSDCDACKRLCWRNFHPGCQNPPRATGPLDSNNRLLAIEKRLDLLEGQLNGALSALRLTISAMTSRCGDLEAQVRDLTRRCRLSEKKPPDKKPPDKKLSRKKTPGRRR